MDPVTHALSGALLAKTLPLEEAEPRKTRSYALALVLASELPDVDYVFHILNPDSPVFYHRGLTHSVLFGLIAGCVLGWFSVRFFGGRAWKHALAFVLALSAHIFGDFLTSYGTSLWTPFSTKVYSADLFSILTLWPGLILLTAFLWASRRAPLFGWLAVFGFVGLSYAWHEKSLRLADGEALASLPHLVKPTWWYVVKDDPARACYELTLVNAVTGEKKWAGSYPKIDFSDPIIMELAKVPKIKRTLYYNRWPVCRLRKSGNQTEVHIGNLLYRWPGKPSLKKAVFLTVDREGKLVGMTKKEFFPEPL